MAVNNNQLSDHENNDETSSQVSRGRHNVTILNSSLTSTASAEEVDAKKINGTGNSKRFDKILPVNHDGRLSKSHVTHECEDVNEEDDDKFPDMLRVKSEEYSARIAKLQEEYLIPLKEDLSEWINRITDSSANLTADNFMHKLDNGVLICKLAKLIESQVDLSSPPPVAPQTTNTIQPLPLVNTMKSSQSSKFTSNSTVISDLPAVNVVTTATIDQENNINLIKHQNHLASYDNNSYDMSSSSSSISNSSSSPPLKQQESPDATGKNDEKVRLAFLRVH